MIPRPVEVRRISKAEVNSTPSAGEGLEVHWSDSSLSTLSSYVLRTNCPCASCHEKRGDPRHQSPLKKAPPRGLTVLTADRDDELNLLEVWPIGNYALGFRWADGHDTGIFTYSLLHALSQEKMAPTETNS